MSATGSNAPNVEFQTNGKIMLILCGLIASGKSTFAQSLQEHYPSFRRCNQDDLGDRRSVEQLARNCLNQGLSVCIDRTNFNASQRAYWIEIAHEFPGTEIWVIVFDTPYEICAERLKYRTSHPTILNAEQGLSVLSRFAADFEHPATREGFDRILYVKPSDHVSPVYTRSDIAAILQRVLSSPIVVNSAQFAGSGSKENSYYRGNPNSYRVRYGGRNRNVHLRGRGGFGPGRGRGVGSDAS